MVRFSVEDEEEMMSGKKRKKSSEGEKEKKLQRKGELEVEERVAEEEDEEELEEEDDSDESSGNGNSNGIFVTIDPDVLDCSICFEPLRSPLFQCRNGHVACPSCCTKLLNRCPACSHSINHSRCLALEKVIESIKVLCSHAKYGCRISLSYSEKLTHEETCSYAPCFCPMPDCTFYGSTEFLSTHFDTCHEGSAKKFRYEEPFEVSLGRDVPFLVFQGQHGDLFLLLNDSDVASGNALSIACMRPNAMKCEFMYELMVRGRGSSLQLKASPTNVKDLKASPTKVFLLVPRDFCSSSGEIFLDVCIRRKG